MLKNQFPILNKKINGKPMIYFDNSATTQKPKAVIEAISNFYANLNSNIHRSLNPLGEEATKAYEEARMKARNFLKAKSEREIIFTRGATESINLVAQTWGAKNLKKGDRVVLSIAEHHANLIPWLKLKEKNGVELAFIPLDKDFELDMKEAEKSIQNKKTKLLAIQHASNVLGNVNPIQRLIKIAKQNNAATLIDAAQSIAHIPINASKLNCDFLVFSGHKIFGPTGIGVLYGREEMLEEMPIWQGGGDMIREAFIDRFAPNELPYKFEAGTPHIAGAIGLGVALNFVEKIGFEKIQKKENELTKYFLAKLKELDFITLYGSQTPKNRLAVFSCALKGVHPHDAGDILGQAGIITRAGHHCAQTIHDYFKIPATLRLSLSIYNTKKEIDIGARELKKVYKMFN